MKHKKIIDTFETYHIPALRLVQELESTRAIVDDVLILP
jgi:hypothetical protein